MAWMHTTLLSVTLRTSLASTWRYLTRYRVCTLERGGESFVSEHVDLHPPSHHTLTSAESSQNPLNHLFFSGNFTVRIWGWRLDKVRLNEDGECPTR